MIPPMPGTAPSHPTLEVCAAGVDDAITATASGADRLELNAALELDGLTPSLGLLEEVRRAVHIPVVAMARPRPGDFCYTPVEFRVLRRDIDLALEHGADGIAFGVLTEGHRIDVERCREVVRQVEQAARSNGPRFQGAVFHRAFDAVADPHAAMEQLIDLGVRRVMTSGQRPTALEGSTLIAELVRRAAGRIEILPAGGVRPANAAQLLARTGCDQLHASLRDPATGRLSAALLRELAGLFGRHGRPPAPAT